MRQDRQGSWYLLTGAVLGAALGLFYSWVVSPVQYVDAPPYALRADFKNEYRALVAASYLYSSDLIRAEDRLAQLKDDDISQSLAMQAQQALADGRPEAEVKALGFLAMALENGVTPTASVIRPSPAPSEITPTSASSSTPMLVEPLGTAGATPQPSSTPISPVDTQPPIITTQPVATATQGADFILHETKLVCNPDQPVPLIQVDIQDAAGQPVPGLELVITWNGGEDHFFTGLKPELGLGYADFTMSPGVVYSLHLVGGEQSANDLTAAECLSEDETRYWGSWMLTFVQP